MPEADASTSRSWSDSDEGFKQFLEWQQHKKEEEDAAISKAADDFPNTEKWRKRKKAAIWVLSIVLSAAGAAYAQFAPEAPRKVEPKDVKDAVDVRVGALEKSINGCETIFDKGGKPIPCSKEEEQISVKHTSEMANKKAERLGDLHFDQRGLILDVRKEIVDKLDAKSGRDRRAVEVPPSVGIAQEQVEAYKKRKNREKLEESLKKGDPFADL